MPIEDILIGVGVIFVATAVLLFAIWRSRRKRGAYTGGDADGDGSWSSDGVGDGGGDGGGGGD